MVHDLRYRDLTLTPDTVAFIGEEVKDFGARDLA